MKLSVFVITALLTICVGCRHHGGSANGLIPVGKLQVYYEREGSGRPLLLLHAGLQDHTMWKEQVDVLSKQFEVITVDLPFHGATMGQDTVSLAADVLKTVLDSLHLGKVSVAGLSMGASVAQDFIIAYPQRVDKAVLISAGINGYDKYQPVDSVSTQWWGNFEKALHAKDTAGAAREFTKAWAEGVYRAVDSLKAPVSKYIYKTTLKNLQLHKMEGWPVLKKDPPAVDKLSSITVPVLIIHGDKDLPYVGVSCQYLEKTIPGAKRVLLKDVAHMLNMEKPGELNKLIGDFLKH